MSTAEMGASDDMHSLRKRRFGSKDAPRSPPSVHSNRRNVRRLNNTEAALDPVLNLGKRDGNQSINKYPFMPNWAVSLVVLAACLLVHYRKPKSRSRIRVVRTCKDREPGAQKPEPSADPDPDLCSLPPSVRLQPCTFRCK